MAASVAALLASLLAPLAAGLLLLRVAPLRPGDGPGPSALLRLPLALGLGLGLCSAMSFLTTIVLGLKPWVVLGSDALLLVVMFVLSRAGAAPTPPATPVPTPTAGGRARLLWRASAAILAALGAVGAVATAIARPHGDGDAIGIWNMRAHFLDQAWGQWNVVFWEGGLAHVDYPLAVPMLVVRAWTYAGTQTALVPAAIGLLFTALTALALGAAVARRRGPGVAALAVVALLGSPFFVAQGALQTADIPMAFFLLAAVLAAVSGAPGLAACGAALAAWTKNEGALCAGALAFVYAPLVLRRPRALLAVALGAALPVAALVVFKVWLAPSNDLAAVQTFAELWARATDGARYQQVAGAFLDRLVRLSAEGEYGGCGFAALAGYAVLAGRERGWPVPVRPLLALALVGLAYAAIFVLITPYNLDWHLRTASGRLLLQLWPATLLLAFMTLRVPGGAPPPRPVSLRGEG